MKNILTNRKIYGIIQTETREGEIEKMPIKGNVNKNYNRAGFSTMIDVDVQKAFSAKCKEQGIQINLLIECFMKAYISGDFELDIVDKRKLEKVGKKRERESKLEDVLQEVFDNYNGNNFGDIKTELERIMEI